MDKRILLVNGMDTTRQRDELSVHLSGTVVPLAKKPDSTDRLRTATVRLGEQ